MNKLLTILMTFMIAGVVCMSFPVSAAETKNDVYVYINLWHKRLQVINTTGNVMYSFKIAPGAKDTPSPVGIFHVIYKSQNWGGGFGSRWIGLDVSWGKYGIHGTNRPEFIGKYVSHGCIRLKNKDIEKVYQVVPEGAKVVIDGPIMGHEDLTYRILVPGSKGALVMLVQNRLQAAGYYKGKIHGKFDRAMERAVFDFQRKEGLPITGQIRLDDLHYLGVVD